MLARWLQRRVNGIRKVAAGLRPFSESVWPGVRNDLFVAHASIYRFASGFCAGKRVLDAGCGTGYGASELAARGAASVSGVDLDARNIAYARRHYGRPNVRFETGDLERLVLERGSLDLVVASNSLEHLHSPERFFETVAAALAPGGVVIVAVPPVRNPEELAVHGDIAYHRAPLAISEWSAMFARRGFSVRTFLHQLCDASKAIDFSSPFASRLRDGDFTFVETTYEGLRFTPTLTAIYVLEPIR